MYNPREENLTEGPLFRQIVRFSLPLVLSNMLQVFFNMSDIAVVGRFAGARALGAVGSTAILVTLFTGFLIGMGSGINVIVARYLGARADRDVREAIHTSFLLMTITGLCLLMIGFGFSGPLLRLLGTKDELISGAIVYLKIYSAGMPGAALFNFGSAVLAASGDTRRPLVFLSCAGVLNVLLNLFFVIVCRMAEAGVALASAISQSAAALLILVSLTHRTGSCCLSLRHLRITPVKARQILSLSIPSGMQNAIFAIANLFVQAGVNTFDAVMVEGNSAAANADGLVYDIMAAIYTACSSFMSQNYGAGKRKRVIHSYYISLSLSLGAGLLMGGMLVLFGRQFLSIFTSEKEVVEAGMFRLRVMGLSYGFSAFMDCTIAASRGLGKSAVPTVIVILGSCVFRVIWVYTVFAYFHTITSLYLLYIFSWTLTAVAEILYFARCWKEKRRRMPEE
ncbi:MAG: MATE family efflux transporter [Clostridia bacterium]|nr:MATE family efflux transporter [Clostridia bacterium]